MCELEQLIRMTRGGAAPIPRGRAWFRAEMTRFVRQPLAWTLAAATLGAGVFALGLSLVPPLLAIHIYITTASMALLARRSRRLRIRAIAVDRRNNRLRSLLEDLPAAVWFSTDGGRHRIPINDRLATLAGVSRAEPVDRESDRARRWHNPVDWASLILPADADHVMARIRKAELKREPLHVEYRLDRGAGAFGRVLDLARPLSIDEDETGGEPSSRTFGRAFVGVSIATDAAHERAAALEREAHSLRDNLLQTERSLQAARSRCERLERDEAALCREIERLRESMTDAHDEALRAADALLERTRDLSANVDRIASSELLRPLETAAGVLRGLFDPHASARRDDSAPTLFDDENAASTAPQAPHPRAHARLAQEQLACDLGDVIDLSLGGMRVRGRGKPPTAALTVTISDHDAGESVSLDCNVVWSRRTGWRAYEAGLRFTSVDAETARALTRISMTGRRRRIFEHA